MAIGVRTRDGNGKTSFLFTKKNFRVVHAQYVSAGSSGQVNIPGVSNYTHFAYCVYQGPPTLTNVTPSVKVENDRVVWETTSLTPTQFRVGGVLLVVGYA